MKVLVFEPGYAPYESYFKSSQEAIEKVVRKEHQVMQPFDTDIIALVCAKDQNELPLNRTIGEEALLRGRFFLCGWDGKELKGLTKEQISRYSRRFWFSERFEETETGVTVYTIEPKIRPADERIGTKRCWLMDR